MLSNVPLIEPSSIFAEPRRYLELRVDPPLSDRDSSQHLEDEIRRQVRKIGDTVGVIVLPGASFSRIFLIDLQLDLLDDPQEKLVRTTQAILGSSDDVDIANGSPLRQHGKSSRVRQALVSGAADNVVIHTMSAANLKFTGQQKPVNIRIVNSGSEVAAEFTITGIARGPSVSLQLQNARGRLQWAVLKIGDLRVRDVNAALDAAFPKLSVSIRVAHDDHGGREIQAAELIEALQPGAVAKPLL